MYLEEQRQEDREKVYEESDKVLRIYSDFVQESFDLEKQFNYDYVPAICKDYMKIIESISKEGSIDLCLKYSDKKISHLIEMLDFKYELLQDDLGFIKEDFLSCGHDDDCKSFVYDILVEDFYIMQSTVMKKRRYYEIWLLVIKDDILNCFKILRSVLLKLNARASKCIVNNQ